MNWTDLKTSWTTQTHKLVARFPYLERKAVAAFKGDQTEFAEYLAGSHHLTVSEAKEELEDYMYSEMMARDIGRQGTA